MAYYHQGDYYGRGGWFSKVKKLARGVTRLASKASPALALAFPTVAGPLAMATSLGSKLGMGGGAPSPKRGISPVTPPSGARPARRLRARRSYRRARGDYGDDWVGNRPSRAKRSGQFLTRRGGRRHHRRRMTALQRRYFGPRRPRRRSEASYLRWGEVGTDAWLEHAPAWLLRKHGFKVPPPGQRAY